MKIRNYYIMMLLGVLVQSSLYGWTGSIIPLSFNKQTGKWNALFVRRGTDSRTPWGTFRGNGGSKEKGNKVAVRALREQTNGHYDINPGGLPYYEDRPHEDWMHFAVVPYISGVDLFNGQENRGTYDFAWVPIDDVLAGNAMHKGRPMSFHGSLLYGLQHHWNQDILPKLSHAQGQGSQQHAPGGQISWKNLPRGAQGIYFYDRNKQYYEFTNFSEDTVTDDEGYRWPTSENYFQAQKYRDNSLFYNQMKGLRTPREAFDFVRDAAHSYDKNAWSKISISVMLDAVRKKFTQHRNIKESLLGTGDKILVEDAKEKDKFWGAGADYQGENQLGQILMRIRAELRGEIDPGTPYTYYTTPQDYFSQTNPKTSAPSYEELPQGIKQPAQGTKKQAEHGQDDQLIIRLHDFTNALGILAQGLNF